MPKFSAYMRGEEGPQGVAGQPVILNGVVSSSSELPLNLENENNLAYYVTEGEAQPYLYIYTTTDAAWHNLGSVKGLKGDKGDDAGFHSTQNTSVITLDENENAYVTISESTGSSNTEKVFNFDFGIPRGHAAGFSTNQNISISTLAPNTQAYAHIQAEATSPNNEKVFNFEFGIPHGEAADFGEPTISISTVSPTTPAAATITANGSATSKIFNFHFDIPQGPKGDVGDSIASYDGMSFTTGSPYWISGSTLAFPRGDNNKLPIYIINF